MIKYYLRQYFNKMQDRFKKSKVIIISLYKNNCPKKKINIKLDKLDYKSHGSFTSFFHFSDEMHKELITKEFLHVQQTFLVTNYNCGSYCLIF